jgi:DNA adenine methylase
MISYVSSPLRYPGGKQKDVPLLGYILNQVANQHEIREYREPFGGGSLLLYAIAHLPVKNYWGNDAYSLLIEFWQQAQENVEELCELVRTLKVPYDGPHMRSQEWTDFRLEYMKKLNDLPNDSRLHNAARFFVLNRSTASGTTESGGLTPRAYCERFTESSIDRLFKLKGYLGKNVKFTNGDYSKLLTGRKKGVFVFLDPPYLSAEKSALYGTAGNLHKGFNHQLLAEKLSKCNYLWLMTIDNSPEIREFYSSWAEVTSFHHKKPYSMTSINGSASDKSKNLELLISNFKFNLDGFSQSRSRISYINHLSSHGLQTAVI